MTQTTQALVLTAPQTLEVVDRSRAPLDGDDNVRLTVQAAGICGSDVHGFAGVNNRRPVGVVMGHETIGRVAETTAAGSYLEVGQLVAVNPVVSCGTCQQCQAGRDNLCLNRRLYGCTLELDGGLATEMVVNASNCVPIANDANVLGLALIEPMAVGTHAVGLADVDPGTKVLVIGGGAIGLAVTLACVDSGVTPLVCEPMAGRRAVAEQLGAHTCTPDDLASLAGTYDLAFECVGSADTVPDAVRSVHPAGTVICLGIAELTIHVPAEALVIQERRLLGSSAYTAHDFQQTARWVSAKADQLADLVELTVGLADMPRVFNDYHAGRLTAMKTLYVADEAVRR